DTVRSRRGSEAITIETTIAEDAIVEASAFLPNALTELVENAITHNDAAEPRVTIGVKTSTASKERIELCVGDNGPGIPGSEIAIHDNDIETQLDHSTGVGLWLVRWVVAASDGALEFETDGSDGTTVRIQLPKAN
ncbi:MAG: HAMP domain-containing sensor histidine kinase, partial [Natronomonas sp.]